MTIQSNLFGRLAFDAQLKRTKSNNKQYVEFVVNHLCHISKNEDGSKKYVTQDVRCQLYPDGTQEEFHPTRIDVLMPKLRRGAELFVTGTMRNPYLRYDKEGKVVSATNSLYVTDMRFATWTKNTTLDKDESDQTDQQDPGSPASDDPSF